MVKKEQRKKVVVTGGAGFIGSHLVDALVEQGFDVHTIDNLVNGKIERVNKKATFHKADITDFEAIKPIIAGSEYVFHLAALPRVQFSIDHPHEAHETNVNGTFNVLLAAKEAKVKKVIYSGSSSAYGDQDTMLLREDMRANPKSPYALQKYYGELQCKLFTTVYGLPTVSFRNFSVYGPRSEPDGGYPQAIPKFIDQVKKGKHITITGDGTQTRDFIHVRDVVRANILAATKDTVGSGELINLGSGRSSSVNTIAKLIGGKIEYIPARFEPKNTLADNSLALALLGWKPEVTLEEGIRELKKMSGIA
jgi:nucleoside-diphosphate-sugar epimerase